MQITEKEIKDRARALKNLVSFKGKSEEYLLDKAKELLEKEKSDVDIVSMFTDRKEIRKARGLLAKYIEDYTIETISDKNTLKEVIYLEIVQQRLQEKLNEYYKSDSKAVPIAIIEIIHKNSEAILKLKISLGLSREKQSKKTGFDVIENLKLRFKQWCKDNQASRTIICPYEKCGQMIMLRMNTDAWEAQKHPFFKDRLLANPHLIKLYVDGVVTKEDVAEILECSPDYVDWLVDKWVVGKPAPEKIRTVVKEKFTEEQKVIRKRDGRCLECADGVLSCIPGGEKGQWLEVCTNCDYKAVHVCKRKKQTPIDFPDRRNSNLGESGNVD